MSSDSQNVTVTPSDIRSFGVMLDDLAASLRDIRAEALSLHAVDFGVYANSDATSQRYHEAVGQRAAGLDRLIVTADRFTDGTAQLARDYSDINDLNAARAAAITAALGADAQ